MQTPKFGINQINNPTPNWIILSVRIYAIASGIIITWLIGNPIVGPHFREIFISLLGLTSSLVNAIAPLFGIKIDSPTVPKEQVKAIEEN